MEVESTASLDGLRAHLERIDALVLQMEAEVRGANASAPRTAHATERPHTDTQRTDIHRSPLDAPSLGSDAQDRLTLLSETFSLTPVETDLLRIALTAELSPSLASALGRLQGSMGPSRARVGLALRLLEPDPSQRLALMLLLQPHSPLLLHRLIQLIPPYGAPNPLFNDLELALSPAVLWYLLGSERLDPETADYASLYPPSVTREAIVLPPDSGKMLDWLTKLPVVGRDVPARGPLKSQFGPATDARLLLNFSGPEGTGRSSSAEVLAEAWGLQVLEIDLHHVPDELLFRSDFPASLLRDARIFRALPVFTHMERLPILHKGPDGQQQSMLIYERFLRRLSDFPAPVVLVSLEPLEIKRAWCNRSVVQMSFALAIDATRRLLQWQRVLEDRGEHMSEDVPPEMLASYPFSPGQMHDAIWAARNRAFSRGGTTTAGFGTELPASANTSSPLPLQAIESLERSALDAQLLREGCNQQLQHDLESYSRRTPTRFSLEDLIVQEPVRKQLELFQGFIKNRDTVYEKWGMGARLPYGRGLKALFHGPSGTGKTMAAQAIASNLHLDLFKVDMGSLVSKWVGETEKNINKIFDEARLSNAILLFDEADALFGKRGAVDKGSDRYSNMEINHLLQRFEEYDGVVILTCNFPRGIDDAFSRRMHFVVEFPMPDEALRGRLWRNILPADMPLADDVDLDQLVKGFEFSGGNIINIVQSAAFLAAERGEATMMDFMRAVQWEYQKIGRGVTRPEFGKYFDIME